MDPLATPSNTAAATTSSPATAGASVTTPSLSSQQAFQMALSAALNAPNVLGDAGGDTDDDDDGSSLTVRNSMGL